MQTKQPILTILMIVRNEEKFIETALHSLISQTYPHYALKIVDNGSDDSTGEIIERFAKQDDRITLLHQEQNDPDIFLKIMDNALTTKYFMFAAGHDFYAPAFIEKCLAALEADPHVVLSYPLASWFRNNTILNDIPGAFDTRGMNPFARSLVVAYGLIENYQFYGIFRTAPYKSLRRHVVIGNDHVLLAELAVLGSFALVNEKLFFLRMADDWGDAEVYIKKHFPNEIDGVGAFLKQINAYMSIAERVSDPFDKTLFKLSMFTMSLLRYRGTLALFKESITSMLARPDFQDLENILVDAIHYIEQRLAAERGDSLLSPQQETGQIAVTPVSLSGLQNVKVKIAGEDSGGKDLTKIQEGSEFETGLRNLVLSIKPRRIIETGTYIGTGTTRIIAAALRDAGLVGTTFYSIECNPNHHKQALFNLDKAGLLSFVNPLLGLSVPRVILPNVQKIYDDTVRNIGGEDIFVDHQEKNRVALYYHETDFPDIPEDLLGKCLDKFDGQPDLVVLDSAGHMGNVEFNYLLNHLMGRCFLVLDDVHHIKHHKSFQQIKNDPRFELVSSSREKFGFCIAKFDPQLKNNQEQIKRLLFLRADSIGDNVLASAMLPYIREAYPMAQIGVLCQDHIAELYGYSPFVHSVIGFNRQQAYRDETYRNLVIQKIKNFHPDLTLNTLYSRDPLYDLFAIGSGAKTTIAFNGNLANISAELRDRNNRSYTKIITDNQPHKPELARHRDFLEGIGISASSLEPIVWLAPEDEAFADNFFRENDLDPQHTLCLFAGAQNNVRIYEHYGAAMAGVCQEENLSVIALGGAEDAHINIRNLDAIGVRSMDLSGKITLRQSAAIMKRCRLAVGAETGLAHIACAVGIPHVVLLGGGHFGRFMPYSPLTSIVCLPLQCYGCNWQCRYSRVHCIRDIREEVLAEAVRQTLAKKSEKSRIFVQGVSFWKEESPRWQWFNMHLDVSSVEIIPVGSVPEMTATVEEQYKEALALAAAEKIEEATAVLERLLDAYPDYALAHNDLGVLYNRLGDNEKALRHYETSLASEPDNILFLKNLADFYYAVLKDSSKAASLYARGLSLEPDSIDILTMLGNIAIENNLFNEAYEFFRKIRILDQQNATVTEILSRLDALRMPEAPSKASRAVVSPSALAETGYLVSAIVSTYNAERFMRGCLDDLEAQTIANRLEIIVIDSCSPQNERAIVEEYQKKYSNIKYIRTDKRETVYAAWNRGIKAASGKYITNANTDDRHRVDAFEVLAKVLDGHPDVALVYGDQYVTRHENETFEINTADQEFRWPEFDRIQLVHTACCGPQPMWRKSAHEELGYFNEELKVAGDYEWWLRLSDKYELRHLNEKLGLYLISESSIEHRENELCQAETRDLRIKYARINNIAKLDYSTYQPTFLHNIFDNVLVSVIIPTFDRPEFLEKAIASVLNQTFKNVEIIVVNDGGRSVENVVSSLNAAENIVYVSQSHNKGPAAARNAGVKMAQGKYVAYLDDDDLFYPNHIETLVRFLETSDYRIAYTDACRAHQEKKEGQYVVLNRDIPYSQDFDYEKILIDNFIPTLCIMNERSCFGDVGLFDESLKRLEDWDMWIRLSRKFRVAHIRKPTCEFSWRKDGTSTTSALIDKKDSSLWVAARRLIWEKHNRNRKSDIFVSGPTGKSEASYKKAHELINAGKKEQDVVPENEAIVDGMVSIVILTFNQLEYTKKCIASIKKHTPEKHEIVFIDNGSTDGTVKWLRKLAAENSHYRLIQNRENLGFARGCNQGIEAARGEFILLLNNDVVATPGWLSGMLEVFADKPETGIVGPMTNNISGPQRVLDVGYASMNGLDGYAGAFRETYRHRRIPMRRIVGFCMLFRKKLADRIGLLDEKFGTGNFEDDDYCLRAALLGYKNCIAGDVFIHHYGSRSFIGNRIDYSALLYENKAGFNRKWSGIKADTSLGRRATALKAIEKSAEFHHRGEEDEAVKILLAGMEATGDDRDVRLALVELLIENKQFLDALDALAPLAQDDARKIVLAGYCREGLKELDEAEKSAERALALQPSLPAALNLKGVLAYDRGDGAASEAFFREAIAADPSYAEPCANLGAVKWSTGGRDEGLTFLKRGFMLSPSTRDIANLYFTAAAESGMFAEAEALFRSAKAIYPRNRMLTFLLIDLLLREEKHAEAMKEIEDAIMVFGADDGMLQAALAVREKVGPMEIDKKKSGSISLCMIVKDEEKYLAGCLMSAKPVVDEMIVVDTGSTDRTREIARALGAKVYDFPWTDDFSAARNVSLSRAEGDWIFVLDADEVISSRDYPSIKKLTARKGKPVAYSIVTRNYINTINKTKWTANIGEYLAEERGLGWMSSDKVRLFPNDRRAAFVNPVHEIVEPSLQKAGIEFRPCPIVVHHYGKLDMEKTLSKGENYYLLGLKKLQKNGDEVKALKELAVQAGELKHFTEAIDLWRRALRLNPNMAEAYVNMTSIYSQMGLYRESLDAGKKAVEIDPESKDAVCNYALSEIYGGNAERAVDVLEELLKRENNFPQANIILGVAYLCLRKNEKGIAVFSDIHITGEQIARTIKPFADALIDAGRQDYATALLEFIGE